MAPMSTMNTTNILNTLLMFLPILCLYLAVPRKYSCPVRPPLSRG